MNEHFFLYLKIVLTLIIENMYTILHDSKKQQQEATSSNRSKHVFVVNMQLELDVILSAHITPLSIHINTNK